MARRNNTRPVWNRLDIDMVEVRRLYEGGLSAMKIARRFGVSEDAILTRVKELGITRTLSAAHLGVQAGPENPRWKGGTSIGTSGYVIISRHKKLAHRQVMEELLGRQLRRDEVVHHINGIKTDNRPENLQIMTPAEHSRHHAKERRSNGTFKKNNQSC